MPTRVDITEDEAITRMVAHLRATLDLNPSRCYETVSPDQLPKVPSGSDYVLTVSPGGGSFGDIQEQFGGQCCEEVDAIVTAFVRVNLDPTNSDEMLLHEVKRGLLLIKRLILKTLVGVDLQRANAEYFLRDLIYAKSSSPPMIGEHGQNRTITVGSIAVTFGLKFDHDLTS